MGAFYKDQLLHFPSFHFFFFFFFSFRFSSFLFVSMVVISYFLFLISYFLVLISCFLFSFPLPLLTSKNKQSNCLGEERCYFVCSFGDWGYPLSRFPSPFPSPFFLPIPSNPLSDAWVKQWEVYSSKIF